MPLSLKAQTTVHVYLHEQLLSMKLLPLRSQHEVEIKTNFT